MSSIQPLLQQTSYDASSHYQNRSCDNPKLKEKGIREGKISITIQSWKNTNITEMLSRLPKPQPAPKVDTDCFGGNPLNYYETKYM